MENKRLGVQLQLSAGASELFRVAKHAAERVSDEPFDRSRPQPRDASLVAVVFSALSIEGFLNDLANLEWVTGDQVSLSASDERLKLLRGVLTISEESNVQSPGKLLLAYEVLGQPLDRGAPLFQDFQLLKQLRDGIVHPKPSTLTISGDPFEFRASRAKLLRGLESRGLLFDDPSRRGLPFLVWLSSDGVAEWAVAVARRTVTSTIEALPQGPFRSAMAACFREFLHPDDWHRLALES